MKWTKGKAIFAGCSGFLMFGVILFAVMIHDFYTALAEPVQPVSKKYNLPTQVTSVLKGVIVSKKTVITPFSKDTVGLCLLRFGTYVQVRNRRLRFKTAEWDYNDNLIMLPGQEIYIKVNDTLYRLDCKELRTGILSSGTSGSKMGETFATDSNIRSNRFTQLIRSESREKTIDSLNKVYFQNLKTIKSLYGLYPDADKFIERKLIKSTVPYTDIIVSEVIFNNGDSIAVKAKIENGKIVPVY